MAPNVFATKLAEFAPTSDDLLRRGLTSSQAEAFLSAYRVKVRSVPFLERISASEALQEFYRKFDPGTVEVGILRFLPRPVSIPNGTLFGNAEADTVVEGADAVVRIFDHASPSILVCECAKSFSHFLSALLVAARFYQFRLRSEQEAVALRGSLRMECMLAAGGPKFESFALLLLGGHLGDS